uniref:Major facilitator superfamily associated domain-containing protein n=1 Tax=Strigamia maritima TaxID=126957 RepID=T1ILJ0_STRMM
MAEETQNKFMVHFQISAIKWDLIILSAGFGFLYAGIGNSEDIQIALNSDKILPVVVRGLFLIARLFSCALLTIITIDKVGNKGTLVIAYGIHLVYLLASLDPRYSTLIPTSIAAGLTSALLWTSAHVYITSLSIGYSKFSKNETAAEASISKFFALFYSIVYFCFSIPAILNSIVLSPKQPEHINDDQLSICGAKYCGQELEAEEDCAETTNITKWCKVSLYVQPTAERAYTLGGLYFGFAFLGFVVILCIVRNLITGQVATTSEPDDTEITLFRQFLKSLGATFHVLRENPAIFLLNFAAFCYGTIEYFLLYDFSKAFVLCASGYHLRGYLLFTFALFASATSLLLVFIYHAFCRLWILGVSTIFVFLCILPLFIWVPTDGTTGVSFVLAILWGIVHSIWNIHLTGLYGLMGRRQLSSFFANLHFWWTVGQFLSFAWSDSLCLRYKLYILCPMLAAATVALGALEVWIRAPSFIKSKRIAPLTPVRSQPEGSSIKTPFKSPKQFKINDRSVIDNSDVAKEDIKSLRQTNLNLRGGGNIDDSERIEEEIKSRESTPPDPGLAPSAPPPPDDSSELDHDIEHDPDSEHDSETETEAEVKPELETETEREVEDGPENKSEPTEETQATGQDEAVVENLEK